MRIPLIKIVIMRQSIWLTSLRQSHEGGEVEGYTRGYEAGNHHQRDLSNAVIGNLLKENALLREALRVKPRAAK